jgi:DNA-binding NarL/FixJ family response regulator
MSSPARAAIRVMLLDDHPVIRQGFAAELNKVEDIAVVGAFTTSRELMEALRTQVTDVLLIDFALGPNDIDGVNLIRALRVQFPKCKILVASGHYVPATVSLALRAGASGFMGKTQPVEALTQAIRTVAAGKRYLDSAMAASLDMTDTPLPPLPDAQDESEDDGKSLLTRHAKLTPREGEVLRCFLDGMSIGEIATKFSRSINTISSQKQSALRKLGIRNDNELFKVRHVLGGI